jgi:hypothetical protein
MDLCKVECHPWEFSDFRPLLTSRVSKSLCCTEMINKYLSNEWINKLKRRGRSRNVMNSIWVTCSGDDLLFLKLECIWFQKRKTKQQRKHIEIFFVSWVKGDQYHQRPGHSMFLLCHSYYENRGHVELPVPGSSSSSLFTSWSQGGRCSYMYISHLCSVQERGNGVVEWEENTELQRTFFS